MASEDQVLHVSRDALRADLVDLELRLKDYFDARLDLKASASDVAALQQRAAAIDRGELPMGLGLAINLRINEAFEERLVGSWVMRSGKAVLASAAIAGLGLVLGIVSLLASHFHW